MEANQLPDDLNPEIVKATAVFIGNITGLVPPPSNEFPPEWHGYLRVFTNRLLEIASENSAPVSARDAQPVVPSLLASGDMTALSDVLPYDLLERVKTALYNGEIARAMLVTEAQAESGAKRGAPEQIQFERKLTCEAIDGVIAFGYQGTNPPPSDDHWLAPFWSIGRKQAELEADRDSNKRMFGAACVDLGLINEALGLDPNDGGAEPILDAIEELKTAALAARDAQAESGQETERSAFDAWYARNYPLSAEALRTGCCDESIEESRDELALGFSAGWKARAAAPQSSQDEADLCERIIHAVEGECDGLAITEEQASNILAYLQYGAPLSDMSEAFRIVDNAIGAAEEYEPEGGNLRIVPLRIDMAREVRAALAAAPAPVSEPADMPEGCTPADAEMLRAANHALAAEIDRLKRRLRPFAQLASSPLSWAMVEYCIDGDPEKQTLQAPQMQRAFNRAADALREDAAEQPSEPALPPAENAAVRNKIAAALHYPEHWDDAAYPTLDHAAWEAIASAKLACSECAAQPSDEQLLALNEGEVFFSETPSKYPEAGHGTQYHAGAPGVVKFARAAISLAASAPTLSAAEREAFSNWWQAKLNAGESPFDIALGMHAERCAEVAQPGLTDEQRITDLQAEIDRLNAIINTPQSGDFLRAVSIEAEHQRQRWGSLHDAGKTPADWFWLVGYLGGKALHAHAAGNIQKAEHHVITAAAACENWHLDMFGKTDMRPGIDGEAALGAQEE